MTISSPVPWSSRSPIHRPGLVRPSRRALLVGSVAAGVAAGTLGGAGSEAARAEDATGPAYAITIDPDTRHQRIEGFGASGAWWAQKLGAWSAPRRNEVARLLFSRGQGIGLSQYRYNIGGGTDETITDPWRTAEGFETGPRTYDWSRDAAARRFLRMAADHGVEDLIAFVNSPPRRLTANGHTYGDPGTSNLPEENHEEFTAYLLDVLRHFRDEEGIAFRTLSPINEPQWTWDGPGQEGCHYEPEQVHDLTSAVVQALADSDLDTVVSAPESGEYKALYSGQSYADVLLEDPDLRTGLGDLATHSYWSTDEQRALAAEHLAAHPEVPLTMTEWCEMAGGRDTGMDSALVLARTVHADLTLAGATAWQYWIAVSRYDYHDGLLYTDYVEPGDEERIEETRRLWALGNYSRFLRPGARRIGLDLAETAPQEGAMAAIPFVRPEIATGTAKGERILRVEDPAEDDAGNGAVTYPGNEVFRHGTFDLRSVEIIDDGEDLLVAVRLGADLTDPWGGSPVGHDLVNIDLYVDTGADGGFRDLLPGRRALVADGTAWDRAVLVSGRTDVIEAEVEAKVPAAMREKLLVALEDAQSVDGDTLTVRVPRSFLGDPRPGWAIQVLVTGSEGNAESDSLRVREVLAEATDWNFGGGSDGHEDPNIIDLLVPEGTTQAEALAWTPASRVEVHASAYLDEETGKLVVVAINESEGAQAVEIAVPVRSPTLRLTPWRTSEDESLAKQEAVVLHRGDDGAARGMVTLAPRSVTTFTAPRP